MENNEKVNPEDMKVKKTPKKRTPDLRPLSKEICEKYSIIIKEDHLTIMTDLVMQVSFNRLKKVTNERKYVCIETKSNQISLHKDTDLIYIYEKSFPG